MLFFLIFNLNPKGSHCSQMMLLYKQQKSREYTNLEHVELGSRLGNKEKKEMVVKTENIIDIDINNK